MKKFSICFIVCFLIGCTYMKRSAGAEIWETTNLWHAVLTCSEDGYEIRDIRKENEQNIYLIRCY